MSRIPDGEYLAGVEGMSERVTQLLSKQADLTKDGMQKIAADIQQRAADKAPKGTGTLRDTAYHAVDVHGDEIVGSVHFPAKYAAEQHEHVEYAHPQGGEAKYLEKAMNEAAGLIREKMAEELQKLFGGG